MLNYGEKMNDNSLNRCKPSPVVLMIQDTVAGIEGITRPERPKYKC